MPGDVKPIVDHLFRHESGKLVAVLTKIFGPQNLELAEDVVQDTLIKALEHWKFHGVPQNPSAWLFTAARNKALDVVRREKYHREFATDIKLLLQSEQAAQLVFDQWMNSTPIEDEQLRMMFVCCHPSLPEEAQVAIILKTLCGFSVAEIAHAFVTNEETISKRLYRARQQFREEHITFELPGANALRERLSNVSTAIYLLFNEGYNSTEHDSLIREDLVEESLRLAKMLVDHPLTNVSETNALLALICFQAARLYTRVDKAGQLVQLRDQDRTQWNQSLIGRGIYYMQRAYAARELSTYFAEAAIAHEHCVAKNYESTNWERIVQWYDWLYQAKPDPLIALNRVIAFAEIHGAEKALKQLEAIENDATLKRYYLFFATKGEFYFRLGNYRDARKQFERAHTLTHSAVEKESLQRRIEAC